MFPACSKALRRATSRSAIGLGLLAAAVALAPGSSLAAAETGSALNSAVWSFVDVSVSAGVAKVHGVDTLTTPERKEHGGCAAGDFNGDGWTDLYVVGGNLGSNSLYRNNGDGTFTDIAVAAGVDEPGELTSGPAFADWDGDGDLDLALGGIETTNTKMFENNGDGTFTDVTVASGVVLPKNTMSCTFGDLDNDDDLDLLLSHWGHSEGPGHIWLNDGSGVFTEADSAVGYVGYSSPPTDYTFSFIVTDINDDGWNDLCVSSDFGTSHYFQNDGDGTFTNMTTSVIFEDNGMGNTVADYDNDGDMDWFVTSIYDGGPFGTGNRMYRNDNGVFSDATTTAGVRDGHWGWGASFQDFNNDGWLDIYHVNSWTSIAWQGGTSRMFVSDLDATFTESAASLGVDHAGQGRGTSCFDYDLDGDVDIFIFNNDEQCVLYRNDGLTTNWLQVKLNGASPNTEQIGAKIEATNGASTQTRVLRCGNNYVSQDPAEAHFGLGNNATTDLTITWTDGQTTVMNGVAANQRLVVNAPGVDAPVIESPDRAQLALIGSAPNPFRDGTAIRFSLGQPQSAAVRVFDTAGRLVRTVLDAALPAGTQAVSWDGTDEAGRAVSSGIYYYEVRTADQSVRGKLVRLR
ncbi:MAG: T9SS type A sorting domain-containing protein [Gemmatimonadetes bacterium]|nr:T9SS type A sorting domain-containing protein [Gemmatimonadota bacterium]